MKNWGLDMSSPDQLWREVDKDGSGMILFNEFAEWAIKKNLDLNENEYLNKEQISSDPKTFVNLQNTLETQP